ncbi:MAG: guanylate kinase [Elusimicrobia bacterium]|nr:guanylate kinase [Elusimicrobiota bacterium]
MILVISSPSGGGKTAISGILLKEDKNLARVITCTTRFPRKGEKNGIDYHFLTMLRFEKLIKAGAFAEWARVHGNYYGTPKDALKKNAAKGRDSLLIIDVAGASQIKKKYKSAVLIFLLPPSIAELKKRLCGRKDTADISARLSAAGREISKISAYNYAVINDKLNKAAQDILSIIRAERLKIINPKSTEKK